MRSLRAAGGADDIAPEPDPGDDPSLMRLARDGDRAAFTEVADRHRVRAEAFADRLLRDDDPGTAVSRAIDELERELDEDGTLPLPFRPRLLAEVRRGQQGIGARAAHEAYASSQWAAAQDVYAELSHEAQALLWHGVVEREPATDVARAAGVPTETVADAVAACRARFRDRYVQDHLSRTGNPDCRRQMVTSADDPDGGLPSSEHRAECVDCRRLTRDLIMIERQLDWVIATVALGAHALIYLAIRRRSEPAPQVTGSETAVAPPADPPAAPAPVPEPVAVPEATPETEPAPPPERRRARSVLPGLATAALAPSRSLATDPDDHVVVPMPPVAAAAAPAATESSRRRPAMLAAAAAALVVGTASAVALWPDAPDPRREVVTASPAPAQQVVEGQLVLPLQPVARERKVAVRRSTDGSGSEPVVLAAAEVSVPRATAPAPTAPTAKRSAPARRTAGRASTAAAAPGGGGMQATERKARGKRPAHAGQHGPPAHSKAGGKGRGKGRR